MLFALTLGMDSSCCAVSAYDFPSLEHLLHLLHTARGVSSFLVRSTTRQIPSSAFGSASRPAPSATGWEPRSRASRYPVRARLSRHRLHLHVRSGVLLHSQFEFRPGSQL